ncbi:MAG: cytochrome c [Nitrospirota bacterium]|nr:cytochrome c [Nitrospirota bacterium]
MRNTTIAVMLSAVLGITLVAYAAEQMDHNKMHEMMMKKGGMKSDDRTQLNVPEPMKVMQKRMMREHLGTVQEIVAALAKNDLPKAAEITSANLALTPEEEQRCGMVEKMTGEKDFTKFGIAMHKKADELVVAAKAGNRDGALAALDGVIGACNACHEKFRH